MRNYREKEQKLEEKDSLTSKFVDYVSELNSVQSVCEARDYFADKKDSLLNRFPHYKSNLLTSVKEDAVALKNNLVNYNLKRVAVGMALSGYTTLLKAYLETNSKGFSQFLYEISPQPVQDVFNATSSVAMSASEGLVDFSTEGFEMSDWDSLVARTLSFWIGYALADPAVEGREWAIGLTNNILRDSNKIRKDLQSYFVGNVSNNKDSSVLENAVEEDLTKQKRPKLTLGDEEIEVSSRTIKKLEKKGYLGNYFEGETAQNIKDFAKRRAHGLGRGIFDLASAIGIGGPIQYMKYWGTEIFSNKMADLSKKTIKSSLDASTKTNATAFSVGADSFLHMIRGWFLDASLDAIGYKKSVRNIDWMLKKIRIEPTPKNKKRAFYAVSALTTIAPLAYYAFNDKPFFGDQSIDNVSAIVETVGENIDRGVVPSLDNVVEKNIYELGESELTKSF